MSRIGRAITAITQRDGTVRFQRPPAAKPVAIRLMDWTLVLLWCLVAGVLVATAFAI